MRFLSNGPLYCIMIIIGCFRKSRAGRVRTHTFRNYSSIIDFAAKDLQPSLSKKPFADALDKMVNILNRMRRLKSVSTGMPPFSDGWF